MDSALDLTSKRSPVPTSKNSDDLQTTDIRQTMSSPMVHHYETPSPSPPGLRPLPAFLPTPLPTSLNALGPLGASVFPGSPGRGRTGSPQNFGPDKLPVTTVTPGQNLLTALSGTAALLAGARHIESERLRHEQLALLEQHKLQYNLALGVLAPIISEDPPAAKRPRISTPDRLNSPTMAATDSADDSTTGNSYWERRRRNNQAAKRSRDSRRVKEEVLASRAAQLERENVQLKAQVEALRLQTAKLHEMLYSEDEETSATPSNKPVTPAFSSEIDIAEATAIAVAAQATPISSATPIDVKYTQRQALNV